MSLARRGQWQACLLKALGAGTHFAYRSCTGEGGFIPPGPGRTLAAFERHIELTSGYFQRANLSRYNVLSLGEGNDTALQQRSQADQNASG